MKREKKPKRQKKVGPHKKDKRERERERERERGGPVLNGPGSKWADIGPEFGKMSPNSATQKKRHKRPRLFAFDTAKCPFSKSRAKVFRRFTTSRFFVSHLKIVRLL